VKQCDEKARGSRGYLAVLVSTAQLLKTASTSTSILTLHLSLDNPAVPVLGFAAHSFAVSPILPIRVCPRTMGASRCHSFEDASSTGNRHLSLTSLSRSESSQDGGSVRLIEFATINLPFHESPATSQISLSLRPSSPIIAPRLKENRTADAPFPERGRSRLRVPPGGETARKIFSNSVSPDRFIPKRHFAEISSTPFRVNKHPHHLSPEEKVLRRRLPGDDPFLPTRPRPPAFPGQRPTPTRLRQTRFHRPRLVTDPAVAGGGHQIDFLRRVSAGAVWGVGGTSAILGDPSVAVSNGAQSLSGKGSTGPTYVAKFLPTSTKADDQNKHESRLALALDIDPTTRLLGTCVPCTENSPGPSSPYYERLSPFVWKDSAWKKVEREQCKYCCVFTPNSGGFSFVCSRSLSVFTTYYQTGSTFISHLIILIG
jgi:hypothetical protein